MHIQGRWTAALLFSIAVSAGTGCEQRGVKPDLAAQDAGTNLSRLADQFIDQVYFHYAPSTATQEGVHRYDAQLEDYSRAAVDQQTTDLKRFEAMFSQVPEAQLNPSQQGDREMLLAQIQSRLLSLNTIRLWEKNPDQYSSGITNAAYVLMERNFAPPDDRLRSLIARERLMPAALETAHQNLQNPPRIYTEIALEQLPGIIAFFRSDVPKAFAQAHDASLQRDFSTTNAAVIVALESYQAWLRKDVLPRSHGDFRFGADTYARKLLYDEMVDTPLPRLLEIGLADLHKNQAEFRRVAADVDPSRPPSQVLAELAKDHPAPAELLQSFRNTFASLTGFIQTRHIVDIPSQVLPQVIETPPFMRATTTASMDTPGPFERSSTDAFFNVTLPEPPASPRQTEEMMEEFNRGTIVSVSIHEAFPGHYVQFLWTPQARSTVRKLFGASTNVEGWAHYCEQMMLDEGYAQPGTGARDARDAKMIRLGQIQDALLRDARFVVGIQMHTGTMTFDQAVNFFEREGYQSHASGMTEAKRGTTDATYLYYTLGKLQIMKLRTDLQQKEGSQFSLERFHDDFLKQGFPPIRIVRRALLGDTSPTL